MWENNNANSGIPIVQGVAVSSGHQRNTTTTMISPNESYGEDFGGSKGEQQPKLFNDIFFALLFYAHLGVMGAFLAVSLGLAQQNGVGYSGIIYLCIVCGVFAIGLATVSLGFMMQFTTGLIKVALFFSIGCSFAMGIIGFMFGQLMMGIMGLISFAFGCCYAYMVWSRIPFAAANLTTALTAVRSNLGTAVVAYIFLGLAMGWTMWWGVVASGMMDAYGNGVLYLFLVSYYWTHQVLQNTVHVTVAGVIGTWWFSPDEASSFCSQAIFDSLARASTYSFGSICFGSLIVALIQALRALNHQLRGNDEFQIVVCIIDCILGCIETIVEYFNKWGKLLNYVEFL